MTDVADLDTDVLVAGGGIAGLMSAYVAAEAGARVVVVTGSPGASNFVQSLNTVLDSSAEDRSDGLFDDMLRSGGYINNLRMAAQVAQRIGPETKRLADLGVPFSSDSDHHLLRRRAAGSSSARAVFTDGMVGVEIMKTLKTALEDMGATIISGGVLVDLIVSDSSVLGGVAYVPKQKQWLTIESPAVVLATGGIGQLFGYTTNHPGSTGAGYGMALAAGVELTDLEFVSFEPFVTCAPEWFRGRDMPTTVMNQGGRLRNALGQEFLGGGPLPGKDVVCRAMVREVEEGRGTAGGGVVYDVRDVDPGVLAGYVQLDRAVAAAGTKELEVMPAQHYLMGGVRTDEFGATNMAGLYAVGEAAGGAHGAHRLAGGGGTEVVALGAVVGESAAAYSGAQSGVKRLETRSPLPRLLTSDLDDEDQHRLATIRSVLDRACGIFRDGETLAAGREELGQLGATMSVDDRTQTYVGRSLLVADAMVTTALLRTESRGDHFRRDFPVRDDFSWLGNIRVHSERGSGCTEFAYQAMGDESGTVIGRSRFEHEPVTTS